MTDMNQTSEQLMSRAADVVVQLTADNEELHDIVHKLIDRRLKAFKIEDTVGDETKEQEASSVLHYQWEADIMARILMRAALLQESDSD